MASSARSVQQQPRFAPPHAHVAQRTRNAHMHAHAQFDQYGNPTLRNKFKNKASELKTKSSFTAFLARQNAHSVQLGQAAVDSDGNPISWDERREQAKRAAEAQRDASEERFREKQVLMMERKLKKDQRREALKQKKAEESLV